MGTRWWVLALVLVGLVGCYTSTPRPAPSSNTSPPPREATPDAAAPEVTACQRYHALSDQVDACSALSEEVRQDIAQRSVDMQASISESGLDDSTLIDPEALCEEEVEYLLRVAGAPCEL